MADMGVRISDETGPAKLAGAWQLPVLRAYQSAALARWKAAGRRGVIALPTGSGKTVVAIAAIAELAIATLVLVPTRVLLDQWARSLSACWSHPIGRLGDGDHHVAPITVSTFASATSWMTRIGDRFGLVVVDEAHHVGSLCPADVFEMLPAAARLGLTATPPAEGAELMKRIGPVVCSLSIADLAGDALAPFTIETVPIALTLEERRRYRDLRGRFAAMYSDIARYSDGGWSEFVQIAAKTPAGRDALEAWRAYRALVAFPDGKRLALRQLLARHAGVRTIVFTADNVTAYAIARELLISPITHEIGRVERAGILDRFRRGEITTLVSAQVLDEGLDVPDADIAIVVGGTASSRRHVQRIGRVLRPRDGKRAIVYELVVGQTVETQYLSRRREGLAGTAQRRMATGGAS